MSHRPSATFGDKLGTRSSASPSAYRLTAMVRVPGNWSDRPVECFRTFGCYGTSNIQDGNDECADHGRPVHIRLVSPSTPYSLEAEQPSQGIERSHTREISVQSAIQHHAFDLHGFPVPAKPAERLVLHGDLRRPLGGSRSRAASHELQAPSTS